MFRRFVPVVCVLLAAPVVFAQSHGDVEERMLLLHDGLPDGYAVAGSLAHFGFALVGADGEPVVHRDSAFSVRQGDRVIFETEDAHEYDGLFSLDVALPEVGPYAVEAASASGGAGANASFSGMAAPPEAVVPRVELDVPASAPALTAVPFGVRIVDANGSVVPHSDAIVEVRRVSDGGLVARFHGHTHEENQTFGFAFPTPGAYEVHVTGYNAFPTPDRPGWRSVSASARVNVEPASGVPVSPAFTEADRVRDGDGLVLHLTTDPTSFAGGAVDYPFGPGTLLRLSGFVVNETGPALVQHVDFEARLTGPFGEVFGSDALHEYDGHYELVVGALAPGEYRFELTATRGDWSAQVAESFRVLPPALPLTAGAYHVEMEPVEARPGEATDLRFSLVDDAGRPLSHGEVDVTIVPADGGAQVANFKLHTHGSGRMSARYAFPSEGAWLVRATPSILEAKTALATAAAFPVHVGAEVPEPAPEAVPPEVQEGELDVPTPSFLVAAAGVIAVALTRRRAGTRGSASRTRDMRPGSSGRAR